MLPITGDQSPKVRCHQPRLGFAVSTVPALSSLDEGASFAGVSSGAGASSALTFGLRVRLAAGLGASSLGVSAVSESVAAFLLREARFGFGFSLSASLSLSFGLGLGTGLGSGFCTLGFSSACLGCCLFQLRFHVNTK